MNDRGSVNTEQAFQRSKIYRLLSYCFFYPDGELAAFLQSGEFGEEMVSALEKVIHGRGTASDITSSLHSISQRIGTVSLDEMIDEHVRLLTFKSASPPYENEYHRAAGAVYSTEEMADIAGFYRAMGIDFVMERPDHIATELEFMHVVTLREAEAISRGETDQADACVSLEKKFLCDHLGTWVDAFSEALGVQGSVFYGALSELLSRWIQNDCAYLQVTPKKVVDLYIEKSEEDEQICLGRVV